MDPVARAAAVIRAGGLVAFPTETAYGLGVDATNPAALARLFAVKERPLHKPVLVLVDDVRQLDGLAARVPEPFRPLMAKHWPGPLTLIFPARPGLPDLLTAGTGTIGVRLSSHPLARALVRAVGGPVTATSANRAGEPPARDPATVARTLGHRLDHILDGGPITATDVSTIVALRDGRLCCVRRGVLALGLPDCR